jgi:hypothetical protein
MNCPCTRSISACQYARSSGVISRNGFPASLSFPLFTVSSFTSNRSASPFTFTNWETTPIEPVSVPGAATIFGQATAM